MVRFYARMAEKVNMEVVGIIENMSYYKAAPQAAPTYIFGRGGGAALAKQLDVPLIGEIPLDPLVREGGDQGHPIVLTAPESAAAQVFRQAAQRLRERLPLAAKV